MRTRLSIAILAFLVCPRSSPAGNGPAGSFGPCSHVIGPLGSNGQPLGFTCSDVGGNALLVWNATQLTGTLSVSGGIKTLNLMPSDFVVAGTFTSDGPVAFIGNGAITVTGSVTGTSVLLASLGASQADVSGTLLGTPSSPLTSSVPGTVRIESGAKVTATSGNAVVVGSIVVNAGTLSAANGTAVLKTGTKLEVTWDDVTWLDGIHATGQRHSVGNVGVIKATNVILEAHRGASTTTSIFNGGKIIAKDTVTLVTGHPGSVGGTGNYSPGSFGISNLGGTIRSVKVVISPYYVAPPGGTVTNRTLNTSNAIERTELSSLFGGQFFAQSQNTPPGGATAVVNTTTSGTAQPTTANLVIPQLAVSVTHMNSTSAARAPIAVASNNSSEVVRGAAPATSTVSKKPRVKAKPILLRGSFFNSKISAKITASR